MGNVLSVSSIVDGRHALKPERDYKLSTNCVGRYVSPSNSSQVTNCLSSIEIKTYLKSKYDEGFGVPTTTEARPTTLASHIYQGICTR
jgi:hypothetical protein